MAKKDWKKIFKKITSFGISIFTLTNIIACNSSHEQEHEQDKISLASFENIDNLQERELARNSLMTSQDHLLEKLQIINNDVENMVLYASTTVMEAANVLKKASNELIMPRELTLQEKEQIVRYLFDLEDEFKWKEVVSIIFGEGGCTNPKESYNVSSTNLNRITSYVWVNWYHTDDLYTQFTNGQYTAYNNPDCGYYDYLNMSLDDLRNLKAYEGIINCLFSQIASHNYSEFRSKGSKSGIQLESGGNKYSHKLNENDFIPFIERSQYQKIKDAIENPNHELFVLFNLIREGDMPILDYYKEVKNLNNETAIDENISLKRG